jgi:hypothetical protein
MAWGMMAAVLSGLATSALRAGGDADDDVDPKPAPRPSAIRWNPRFLRMMGVDETNGVPKKNPAKSKKEVGKEPSPVKPISLADEAAGERARAEANLMRRLQVCDKLTEIALKTNDTPLLHQAEALDERARTAYAQRTSHLRTPNQDSEPDDKGPDKQAGSQASATARSPNAPALSVAGDGRTSRAAKEVNP